LDANQDYHDTVFEPARREDDWLLISGEFLVGRVLRDRSGPQAKRFSWDTFAAYRVIERSFSSRVICVDDRCAPAGSVTALSRCELFDAPGTCDGP
jgi:hypothetical protein